MGSDPLVRPPPAHSGPGPLGGDGARETLALGDDGQGCSGRGRRWLRVGSRLPLLARPCCSYRHARQPGWECGGSAGLPPGSPQEDRKVPSEPALLLAGLGLLRPGRIDFPSNFVYVYTSVLVPQDISLRWLLRRYKGKSQCEENKPKGKREK